MVTEARAYAFDNEPYDLYGLSADTKPLDVPNGSRFTEMDTSKIHLFDAENSLWLEWGAVSP